MVASFNGKTKFPYNHYYVTNNFQDPLKISQIILIALLQNTSFEDDENRCISIEVFEKKEKN